MPGVSFNSQPGVGPSDDPIQDAYALVVILSSSETSSNLDVKLGLNSFLEEIQVFTAAEDSEVVTMNDTSKVTRFVGEAAGRFPTLSKAQAA